MNTNEEERINKEEQRMLNRLYLFCFIENENSRYSITVVSKCGTIWIDVLSLIKMLSGLANIPFHRSGLKDPQILYVYDTIGGCSEFIDVVALNLLLSTYLPLDCATRFRDQFNKWLGFDIFNSEVIVPKNVIRRKDGVPVVRTLEFNYKGYKVPVFFEDDGELWLSIENVQNSLAVAGLKYQDTRTMKMVPCRIKPAFDFSIDNPTYCQDVLCGYLHRPVTAFVNRIGLQYLLGNSVPLCHVQDYLCELDVWAIKTVNVIKKNDTHLPCAIELKEDVSPSEQSTTFTSDVSNTTVDRLFNLTDRLMSLVERLVPDLRIIESRK
jgi:hypothetical protein